MENPEEKILQILKETHVRSGGHNGSYVARLRYDLNIDYQELKNVLEKLEFEDKIYYREGHAGKLVFWKPK